MYSTSDKYKELIYSGKKCLLNIYIDGTLINDDDIYSFKVIHNLFDGGKVSLGSTTSKSIELEINREALPETYSNFYVETGLTIDGVDEIVPIGYFTLEEIHKDEDVVSITAVDYMMKFEKIISDFVSSKAIDILQAICDICGVELATTDFIGNDTELIIYDGTTMTARQVMGYIAELAGGFATIGRDGKLYIKKIGENTTTIDIDLFGDYSWGEKFVCNEVDFINDNYNYEISDTDYSSAYLDCVLDSSLYGGGQSLKLNGNNPFITTEEQVHTIYELIKGLEINGFNGQSLLDPALDIGDIIYIDDKPVVFQGDMEYLGYFKGNISSQIETEEKNETTVQKINLSTKLNKVSNQVNKLEAGVENKVDSDKIISSINKSDEEIQIQAEKVSLKGKTIDLTGDSILITSNNFSVDEEGNVVCKNADITGKITVTTGKIAGFNITEDALYKGTSDLNSNTAGIYISSSGSMRVVDREGASTINGYYSKFEINDSKTYTLISAGGVQLRNNTNSDGSKMYGSLDIYDNEKLVYTFSSNGLNKLYIYETLEVDGGSKFNGAVNFYGQIRIPGGSLGIYDTTNMTCLFGQRVGTNGVVVNAANNGTLYLGYWNTGAIDFFNGKVKIDGNGYITAPALKRMVCGEVDITPSAKDTPTVKAITFSGFSATPKIVATAKSSVPGTTVTGVGASATSSTSANIYVTRTNTTSTTVYWIAMQA